MKMRATLIVAILIMAAGRAQTDNNDFYDNEATVKLDLPDIEVSGEVAQPGKVRLAGLTLRSVMVREAVFAKEGNQFVGAYRYDGYSLYDILREVSVDKKNRAEFGSPIDLLVTVENAEGDWTVLSWGEIFYPAVLHRILIATQVAPILPSKTKEQWPIPQGGRLVCANDLITVRTIVRPTRIRVRSCPLSFPVDRSGRLYAPAFRLLVGNREVGRLQALPSAGEWRTFDSVFYGRGAGFHGVRSFRGKLLSDALHLFGAITPTRLKRGVIVLVGRDGYRTVVSASELFNRNDGAAFILVDRGKDADGGRFSLFPSTDFFSDRAVKAVSEIRLLEVEL